VKERRREMRKFLISLVVLAIASVIPNQSNLLAMEEETAIPVGTTPVSIVFSQSGDRAYVSNWGRTPSTPPGTISIIDTATKSVDDTITCQPDNHSLAAVTQDQSYLYMTTYYGGRLVKVRLSDLACVGSLDLGSWANGCHLSPDDQFVYVQMNYPYLGAPAWIEEVDTDTMTSTGRTIACESAGDHVFSSDGRYLYLVFATAPKIDVVDVSSFTVIHTIDLPARAYGSMVLSCDDTTLYTFSLDVQSIFVASSLAHDYVDTVVDTIPGINAGIDFSRIMDVTCDGRFLYVSLPPSQEVAKVSTSTHAIVDRITLSNPIGHGLALTPDENYLYVCNSPVHTVTVIRTETPMPCFEVNKMIVKDKIANGAKRDKIKLIGTMQFEPGSEPFEAPPAVTVTITYDDPPETIEVTFPEESFEETDYPGTYVSRIDINGGGKAIMKVNFDECFWKVIIKGEDASGIYDSEEMPTVAVDFGGAVGTDTFEDEDWTKKIIRNGKRIAKFKADPQVNCCECSVSDDGLLAYYPLDGNAYDASGNGLDGTPENGTSFTLSTATLDGIDDYIDVSDDGSLSGMSQLTVTARFRADSWYDWDTDAKTAGLVCKVNNGDGDKTTDCYDITLTIVGGKYRVHAGLLSGTTHGEVQVFPEDADPSFDPFG
jgi:DNA-binding beta-propeller fold protein YncE